MDSWARLACYPQGTFYPLSDHASTSHGRVTKPCFRTCLTCQSRSQAPLCLCTRRLIANQPEGTFGRLRYTLGPKLETRNLQAGISTLTPPRLAPQLPSLPAILHNKVQIPTSSYSKGPWGLSVLLHLTSIFTRTSISPSPWLRQ
jgi:hypothetical protein